MDQESILAHAYLAVVDERIHELWVYRQWCRKQRDAAHWSPLRVEYDAELRALVKLAKKARDLARPAIERADPVTLAKGDHFAGMPTETVVLSSRKRYADDDDAQWRGTRVVVQ